MKPDYTRLDAAILDEINTSPRQFSLIFVRGVKDECEAIAKAVRTSRSTFGTEPFRILDRRLQALRKAGKIHSTSKGWIRKKGYATTHED